jgi:H+/Cl- antiporter ClcA
VGALVLLLLCKSLAYAGSLVAFRGGPTFPAIFLGAAGGLALSHLPGLPLAPAVAMGLGATCAAMLQLPLTSVLLATLMLGADGLTVMPVVIVAVTVSYVGSARLTPRPVRGHADGAPGNRSPDAAEPVPRPRRPRAGAEQARPPAGA